MSGPQVGHGHADPEEMFRQFFGEDFQGFAPGQTGGVRFQRFGGGQVTGLQPVPLAVLHDELCGLQR